MAKLDDLKTIASGVADRLLAAGAEQDRMTKSFSQALFSASEGKHCIARIKDVLTGKAADFDR